MGIGNPAGLHNFLIFSSFLLGDEHFNSVVVEGPSRHIFTPSVKRRWLPPNQRSLQLTAKVGKEKTASHTHTNKG